SGGLIERVGSDDCWRGWSAGNGGCIDGIIASGRRRSMDIALCYESVLPARGGCEHYISDLAPRLAHDGHAVHLYACRWDAAALPATTHLHRLPKSNGPRFLRPWRFAQACADALRQNHHDVTMGFDKTWGQDILYPQGGLHVASSAHNLL